MSLHQEEAGTQGIPPGAGTDPRELSAPYLGMRVMAVLASGNDLLG
jgi:hypothetical protein